MFDFHEKRKLKGLVYSKITAILIVVAAILISFSVFERYVVEREMSAKKEEVLSELHELETKAASLESEVRRLKSERGIEEEIRDRFEVAKEGEQVVVIVGSEDSESEEEVFGNEDETVQDKGFLGNLLFWQR